MSRRGEFEEFEGDSSEIVVAEALRFLEAKAGNAPTFTVIWYGTPHAPFVATPEDRAPFSDLPDDHQNQYGEIAAMDRSIGALRHGLRDLGIADNTLFWFCSDNGGLAQFGPETMGGLRGNKGNFYEGGLRVPGIIEWPARVPEGRITQIPSGTVDIFPTVAEIAGLDDEAWLLPRDGMSILSLIEGKMEERGRNLPFRQKNYGALIGDRYKLLVQSGKSEVFDLIEDPVESRDITAEVPEIAAALKAEYDAWNASVEDSVAGKDYPEGTVRSDHPEPRYWMEDPSYAPYLPEFLKRPEYKPAPERSKKKGAKSAGDN